MDDLYREIIIDRYKNPQFKGSLEPNDISFEDDNPLCGDQFTVYVQVEDEVIQDISFQGSGCAISKASASMMTDAATPTIARSAPWDRVCFKEIALLPGDGVGTAVTQYALRNFVDFIIDQLPIFQGLHRQLQNEWSGSYLSGKP